MSKSSTNSSCTLCGKPVELDRYNLDEITAIMREKNLCFNCAFWHWQHNLDQNDPGRKGNFAVINGTHYVLDEHTDINWPKGFGGAEFKIRFNDGREVICDNLWSQGDIPEHLKNLFPDNAVFVK